MGIYSLILLFLGIFIIGLVYDKTDNDKVSHHVLYARLPPLISFDVIGCIAGLSGIRPWAFILGTALVMLPATIIYTFIGNKIPAMEENFPLLLTYSAVFIFILVVFSLVQGIRRKT